ncbi:WYL domain-containing protein [Mariniplasma anaerobium]|uniref:WYL domain-containing protein n=1 Tax=Mariniplasma anaerobium TaxID=2735436 RepID=A0A7U9XUT1_9MOLU|nr:hypothetical protein [Mariniplasma anaerobium]BCR35207.1 hypothetical protein MPAN_001000 [Mariniplasma anaerobium]
MDNYNGFIINEESRQHINLSAHAMLTIEADMIRFNEDYELKNKSGFINTIIKNYHDQFPLSRSVTLKQINAIQNTIINDDFSKKLTDRIIEEFTNEIMRTIIDEYSNKYTSEIQFKLKLNKFNKSLLESLEEAKYFNDYAPRSGISFYIKILLESYAVLTRAARESIYFKEIIDILEEAIKKKTYIKFKDNGKFKKVKPVCVYKPKGEQNVEVILMNNSNDEEDPGLIYNTKIKSLKNKDLRGLKEKYRIDIDSSIIKNIFSERDFASKKPKKIFTIKFTSGGLHRFIYEEDRIPIIGIQDPINEKIYTFKTTETQIFFHLFKFGSQAQIISPKDARERFKKAYKASYEAYDKVDAKD